MGRDGGNAWDRNRVLDAMHKVEESRASRRSFLKNAALATGASAAILAGTSDASAAGTTQTLPYQSDSNWVRNHIVNVIKNEQSHITALITELGAFARPAPTFTNITVTTLEQYVMTGAMFCATGAGAYLGAAPYIMNSFLAAQAASIGQVELAQSAYLYSLLDQPFLPGGSPYAVALTLPEVVEKASPYIASLNGGPQPGFTTTPSFQNDIAIFNTALILEYLENEFYSMNYPKFFS